MQFFNTVRQIANSEAIDPVTGIGRHLFWQTRRILHRFPCEVKISRSRILAEKATGVAALVNAMDMYDFNNMKLLQALLEQRPTTFVDVGANVGSYTLIASEIKSAFVVSIEPHPLTFAALLKNIQMNDDRANVACFNLAASDHEGYVGLTEEADSSLNRVLAEAVVGNRLVSVPCRTLDGLCLEHDIRPDIIKIDVEGHELQVLKGLQQNLQRPLLLFIEGGEKPEIRSLMRDNDLLGPLYVHYGEKLLSKSPQRRAEDCLYVSILGLKTLAELGIKTPTIEEG